MHSTYLMVVYRSCGHEKYENWFVFAKTPNVSEQCIRRNGTTNR